VFAMNVVPGEAIITKGNLNNPSIKEYLYSK
jgi:hypothetical protein